jgi:glycerol-3-phosphate dehydrogenase (NAD(P)+)
MQSIGIIGEGSWGTALLKIFQLNGYFVHWLVREDEIRTYIEKNLHNSTYLTDVEIDGALLQLHSTIQSILKSADTLLFVLPSAFAEDLLSEIEPEQIQGKICFSAVKGILPNSNLTVCQFLHIKLNVPEDQLGFISGPSHAEEIAMERLTYLTVLSKNTDLANDMAKSLSCRFIKTRINSDVIGAEYATALKNVMAITVGIAHGLGYGDNFIAVLVSNAIKEIEHFVKSVVPHTRNITDYVYLGDLLVTCYSQFSRNRTLGVMLGKGYSVKAAQLEMNMIAEGYYAVKSIVKIALEKNIEMPISQALYQILYERYSPTVEIRLLTEKMQ